ncbi:MAG: hypothetical protein DWC07_07485 [Candidatus Poseidoniales archaeon]|nr:MAG: hypothetical protein DWC07_07485 [Candidatus Poseidoniales archaeon]
MKKGLSLMLVLTLTLAGCTTPEAEELVDNTPSEFSTPERMSFVANTLDRDVDNGSVHDLRASFDGPVLMLWVASGCSGCHDWTETIRSELEVGNVSNTTNIVSVHRYGEWESEASVAERYGDQDSEHYTPWPLLLPDESTNVINVSSGRMTNVSIYEAFEGPVTPTLQVLDGDGRLVWTSKTYWADTEVLSEALNIMNSGLN